MELAFPAVKNKRGQTSIEFILLILFVLVYISSVTNPMVATANNSAEEVSSLGNAKIASQKIANAIDYVALAPNAKKTINVFVPENSKIIINMANNSVDFNADMDNTENPKPCPPGEASCCRIPDGSGENILVCSGQTNFSNAITLISEDITLDYNPEAVPAENNIIYGKTLKEVVVENTAGVITVS